MTLNKCAASKTRTLHIQARRALRHMRREYQHNGLRFLSLSHVSSHVRTDVSFPYPPTELRAALRARAHLRRMYVKRYTATYTRG